MAKHWSEKIAGKIIEEYPDREEYTVAAGISPSGRIHIGNFRDVITSEVVCRALINQGKNARLLFSWDDFDRFRKVPIGIPESYSQYLGMPLTEIPDPTGEYKSYAEKNEKEFEKSLGQLGISPVFRYQSHEYRSGRYADLIIKALTKRKEIAQILAGFKTQGMTEGEIEKYYPMNIYSRFTGKDNTEVISFDGERKVEYVCKDTGKTDVIDIKTDHVSKLPWRVDWPMRWLIEGVNFEPGGSDHASPGGSYDMGKIISEKIFSNKPPYFQGYGFIGIRGLKGKMSSSSGELVTPGQLLDIYEPQLIRWLFLRTEPEAQFDFSFDSEVFRLYSEFDNYLKESLDAGDMDALKMVDPSSKGIFPERPMPFRQISGYGQATSFNQGKLEELLSQTGETFDGETISSRLPRARSWLEAYNPENMRSLRDSVNSEYLCSLKGIELEQLVMLRRELERNPDRSMQEWETLLYDIPKQPGMSEEEKRKKQKLFFTSVYRAIFGTGTGPRLPTYIWAEDKRRLKQLLPSE